MVEGNARISFIPDILDAIARFLDAHEAEAPSRTELERALVVSYLLGVMRCSVDAVWDALAEGGVFGAADPRALFEECTREEGAVRADLEREALAGLAERGWLSTDEGDRTPEAASE